MADTLCLDETCSTTRVITQIKPEIINSPETKFETVLFVPDSEERKDAGGLRTKGFYKTSDPEKPLVSVITIVYNGEKYLEETIRSVLSQTYDNIEYIIIDGGSNDGTIDIIKKYEDKIDYWISEQDQGISDAFNKGISCAQGEFIGLLNADDYYAHDAVESVISYRNQISSFIFGGCTYISEAGIQTYLKPDAEYTKKIRYAMPHLHHPTIFVKRQIYQQYGFFDLSCKIAMDYDFFLRLTNAGCEGTAINRNIAYMREIGISVTLYKKARKEVRDVSIRHGLNFLLAYGIYTLLLSKNLFRSLLK